MTAIMGTYSLCAAVLVAAFGLFATLAMGFLALPAWQTAARWCMTLTAALLTVASAALLYAFIGDQFQLSYVAGYSEQALPLGYKLAAFWAGQDGSLLLWAWMLGVMSTLAAWTYRGESAKENAATLATLLAVTGFFALLMLFAANPFRQLLEVPADGSGLNPMLQDPGMIAHPPLLFLGYAGFTIPFAMMIGALVGGRSDRRWIVATRRWTLVAWVCLSVGIVLGAQWAYVELGWGGYWAWDPVENASLLPWLTGTALLHSLMVQARRGMFKGWNVGLIALSFILCIFGTYLTRSGVVSSVHSFGESRVGNFFLGFLLLCIVVTVGLVLWRRRLLKPEVRLETLVSREGAFLAGNVLLLVITLVTLVGTIFPLLSSPFLGEPVTVKPPFYNKVVVPMGMLLLGLMAMGPVLKAGRTAAEKIGQVMLAPTVLGASGALVALALGLSNPWALGCVAVCTAGGSALLIDFGRTLRTRTRGTGEGWALGALRLFDSDHRRYGGQMAHVGMLLIGIGITGSSLFGVEKTLKLHTGRSANVGRYTLRFEQLDQVRHPNFIAMEATVTMTDDRGRSTTLRPQRRLYDKSRNRPNTEVALHTTLRDDLYVTLAGWEQDGHVAAIQVLVNPLVAWIWIGGTVLTLGGTICFLPRLLPQARRATVRQSAPQPEPAVSTAL